VNNTKPAKEVKSETEHTCTNLQKKKNGRRPFSAKRFTDRLPDKQSPLIVRGMLRSPYIIRASFRQFTIGKPLGGKHSDEIRRKPGMKSNYNILRKILTAVLVLCLLFVSMPVFADEDAKEEDKSSVYVLENVVITANRMETDIMDVPASLSIIDQKEIEERGVLNARQVLDGIPNVRVEQDMDSSPQIYMRGVPHFHNNNNILVLMDGIPLLTANDEVNMDRIPFYNIDRVEVIRGPVSALYGRNGVSGVINYITKDPPQDEVEGKVNITIGSDYLNQSAFSVGGPVIERKSSMSVGGIFDTGDGWRENTEHKARGLFVKNKLMLSNDTDILLHFNRHENEQNLGSPVPLRADNTLLFTGDAQESCWDVPDARKFDNNTLFAATLNQKLTQSTKLQTKFKYGHENRGYYGQMGGIDLDEENHTIGWSVIELNSEEDSYFVEPQLTWKSVIAGRENRFLIGGSYERIEADDLTGWYGDEFQWDSWRVNYLTGDRGNRNEKLFWQSGDTTTRSDYVAAFMQDEFDVTTKATLSLGLRYDTFFRETLYRATDTGEAAKVKGDKDHFSPKASINYKWTDSISTYATYAHAFNPNFGPIWMYNEDYTFMDPEIVNSYEVGIRAGLLDRLLLVSMSPFFMKRENILVMVSGDDGQSHPDTAGQQEIVGLEMESNLNLDKFLDGLSFFFNYGYAQSEWKDFQYESYVWGTGWVTYDWSGKNVQVMPEHNFSTGMKYFNSDKGYGFNIWYDYMGEWWVDPANTCKSEAYGLLNARIYYEPPRIKGLGVSCTVKNIADKKYYAYWSGNEEGPESAYPGEPLTVIGSVSMYF